MLLMPHDPRRPVQEALKSALTEAYQALEKAERRLKDCEQARFELEYRVIEGQAGAEEDHATALMLEAGARRMLEIYQDRVQAVRSVKL